MTTKQPKKPKRGRRAVRWIGPKSLADMLRPLAELVPDPRNARQHDARNLEAIRGSVTAFGQLRPLVVQESTGHVVAGNGTLAVLRDLGWTHAAVVVAPLSDAKARAFAIADNRTAELASWDVAQLQAALIDPALDGLLDAVGFSAAEIDELIRTTDEGAAAAPAPRAPAAPAAPSASTSAPEPETEREREERLEDEADNLLETVPDDEPPPLPEEPRTKAGDVWRCGDHEVLCADSFGDVAAKWLGRAKFDAVVTDPPYAIYGSSSGIGSDIADDKMVRPFFAQLARLLAASLKLFAHAYIFTDWRSWACLWEALRPTNVRVRNMLVWSKNGSGLGTNYGMTHEVIAFAAQLPEAKAMTGGQKGVRPVLKPNVFVFNRPTGEEREHNAAKPVPLLAQFLANSTDDGALVLDPFGGSGSTMIAAEKTGRRARLVEIEPKWVDVIVARWERVTGRKAERVGDA